MLKWYRASVKTFIQERRRFQQVIEEKEKTMENVIQEKERIIEDKERIIESKDDVIAGLKEVSDIATALVNVANKPSHVQKWGGC